MLYKFVDLIFQVYMLILFTRILSSWIPEFQRYRTMQFVAFYADPYLNIFRRIIPPLGIFDLSPIIALFALNIIEGLVKSALQLMLR